MMTEKEAATKWCPHVRFDHECGGGNRDHTGDVKGWNCCLASRCAMWVWAGVDRVEWQEGQSSPNRTPEGRCGLTR